MISQFIDWIQISLNLFSQSNTRIIWNLFLALIPLTLSFYLFRPSATRSLAWWAFFGIFIAFLPNAPYILTDSIHILELSQADYPFWSIIIILIPQYILFILTGFEAYAIALMKLDNYLQEQTVKQYTMLVNIVIHALCVVGIYIGRFERFNSWDFVTKPGVVLITTIIDLLDPWKLLTMAIAFLLIWLVTETTKIINRQIKTLLQPSTNTY